MSCEGKSEQELRQMSSDALNEAWEFHIGRIELLDKDPNSIEEITDQHEVSRARRIEDILLNRVPQPVKDVFEAFREQLRQQSEGL